MLNQLTQLTQTTSKVETRLEAIDARLKDIDGKLKGIDTEVSGVGKWLHTIKVIGGIFALVVGSVIVNAVWPWIKVKLGIGG